MTEEDARDARRTEQVPQSGPSAELGAHPCRPDLYQGSAVILGGWTMKPSPEARLQSNFRRPTSGPAVSAQPSCYGFFGACVYLCAGFIG
jgi:hypothetical protein